MNSNTGNYPSHLVSESIFYDDYYKAFPTGKIRRNKIQFNKLIEDGRNYWVQAPKGLRNPSKKSWTCASWGQAKQRFQALMFWSKTVNEFIEFIKLALSHHKITNFTK